MPSRDSNDGLPARPSPAPWTASRCARTLRKLTTFVAKVERWHQKYLAALQEPVENEHEEQQEDDSPTWLEQNASRKASKHNLKKTYHQRRKAEPRTPKPRTAGKVANSVVTPRIHTLRSVASGSEHAGASSSARVTRSNRSRSAGVSGTQDQGDMQRCRVWTPATKHLAEEYESIIHDGWTVIPAFLFTTSDPKSMAIVTEENYNKLRAAKKGSRSLRDMCLGKLSSTMIVEQKRNDATKSGYDGQQDFVGELMTDLEDYFGDSKTGWSPLRSVLREYGIGLIIRLITSGAIPEDTALELATRWKHSRYLEDFSIAVRHALVRTQVDSPSPGAGFHILPSLNGAESPSDDMSITGLHLTQMSIQWITRALKTSKDPISILSVRVRFTHLASCIAQASECRSWEGSSGNLLQTIFEAALASGRNVDYPGLRDRPWPTPGVKQQHDLSSIGLTPIDKQLSIRLEVCLCLLFISCLRGEKGVLPELLHRLCSTAQIVVGSGQDLFLSPSQHKLVVHIFLLGICADAVEFDEAKNPASLLIDFESLLGVMSNELDLACDLSVSLMSVFGEDWRGLQALLAKLMSIPLADHEKVQRHLLFVCAETATGYVTVYCNDRAVVAWAAQVHATCRERLAQLTASSNTPARQAMSTAYCWDDAIEDWIVATPAPKCEAHIIPKHGSSNVYDCGIDRNRDGAATHTVRSRIGCSLTRQDVAAGSKRKWPPTSVHFEVYSDGDFQYKKARSNQPSLQTTAKAKVSGARGERENMYLHDVSEDELSLLE